MEAIPKSRNIDDNVNEDTIKDEQVEENKNILNELLSPDSDENNEQPIKSRNVGSKPKKERKKRNKKLIVRNVILVVLALVMAVSGSGFIYYYNTLDSLNFSESGELGEIGDFSETGNFITNAKKKSGTNTDYDIDIKEGYVNMSLEEGSLLNDPMVLNVLLFGADKNDGTSQRSDTMIMLSIDNRHKKIKLTSFMRDLWVYIPDYGYSKLNHAYAYGGPKLAIDTIEQNFGVGIDRYAIVDFASFKAIIDILGGIDIELSDEEIDYINWQCWKNKQVQTRHELTDKAGLVHLNGRQALWYARDRGDIDEGFSGSDFDRTARQRKLLRTIASDMKSASITQIVNIVNQIGPLITTNLKKTEITTLVANSLTYLSYDMVEYRIPSDGNYEAGWHYGMSTLDVPDWDTERTNLAIFVYEELVTDALEGYMTYEPK